MGYWFTTEVEPMCDEGYLYACNGRKDEVTMRCLAKGYFQDWARVVKVDP